MRQTLKLDAPADGVVSGFFRTTATWARRERHRWPRPPTPCCVGACCSSISRRARAAQRSGALAILGWQGAEGFLQGALQAHEQQWLERCRAVDVATLQDKLRHNLPDWLAGALRDQLPPDQFWQLAEALLQPAPLDLRVNTFKAKPDAVQRALRDAGIEALPMPFSPWDCAFKASRRCKTWTYSRGARSRCRTKAASCWPC